MAALEEETAGLSGTRLFGQLPNLAKRAINAGNLDKAEAYAKQLLQMAPQYRESSNDGNAVFYGNLVLGQVALQQGDVAQASQYLLAAGTTHGSATLNTFGPNMTLPRRSWRRGSLT